MNKQEAINKINNMGTLKINDTVTHQQFDMVDKDKVLDIISQIDESKKPVVPQFVADWYKEHKDDFEYKVYELCIDCDKRILQDDLHEWFDLAVNKPIETLVKMHLFGYEVEKEKLYTVEIPDPNSYASYRYLSRNDNGICIDASDNAKWKQKSKNQFTEAEIKQDFDWLWQFAKEVEE